MMTISFFQQIIKSLPRRKFERIVATHKSDKWCKKLSTFDQLIVIIFAQLSGQTSLRDLEVSFNASPGASSSSLRWGETLDAELCQSGVALCVFEAILSMLLSEMAAGSGRKIGEVIEILDSTTLALFRAMRFRSNNSAIKLHLMLKHVALSVIQDSQIG